MEMKDPALEVVNLNVRYGAYIAEQERVNQINVELGENINPNFPPKTVTINEPFGDQSLISSEDYLVSLIQTLLTFV